MFLLVCDADDDGPDTELLLVELVGVAAGAAVVAGGGAWPAFFSSEDVASAGVFNAKRKSWPNRLRSELWSSRVLAGRFPRERERRKGARENEGQFGTALQRCTAPTYRRTLSVAPCARDPLAAGGKTCRSGPSCLSRTTTPE